MKTKTTLILLGVVLALGVWIKYVESKGPNTEEARRRGGNVLSFERGDLEGLVIQNGDDRIELHKSNDKWRLEAPVKDQADGAAVDNLVSDLSAWDKDETFSAKEMEADKNRLSEYDLAKPKLRLKLLGKGMPPEILFGKDAALEGRMYVRFENSKETFLVRQTVKNDAFKKPDDFRDRKLTELAMAQIARVILKTPAGEMELQKHGEFWDIVRPLRARGDSQKINDLVAQVTSARIQQFVADDHADLQPYGLAEPRGSVTLFTAGEKEGQTLQIGAAAEKEADQVYVHFSARSFVYTLPKKIEELLNAKPADLRDRHLARIDTNNLDRLTIAPAGKDKIVLARKEQNWTIASRGNQPGNVAEVNRLLDLLKNEQVTRFVEDVASDLPKYGLDHPQLELTFSSFASENTAESTAGEHPFATIVFGKTEGEEVFARVGDEPFIVAVRRTLLENIFTDPAQWQELAVFKFKPEEVHRLTVAVEGAAQAELVRDGKNEWKRAQGNDPINQVNVQSLVNTLTNLRAVRWLAGPPPPQAFEKAQITVNFTTSPDDKATHTLIIGGPAGGGMWHARVEGRDGAFVLNNPDFNALRLPLTPEAAAAATTPAP